MKERPKLLDLFCGAGGAAMGYHRAGFEVVGVDIKPQPHFPFEFHQADALTFPLEGYDAYHASPPCQGYSVTKSVSKKVYPRLVPQVREMLQRTNKPFVIENVPGAPLLNYLMLCGTMFNLNVIRHRYFEIHPIMPFAPFSCNHWKKVVACGREPADNEFHSVVGHHSGVQKAREAMDIPWMTQAELAQAIPPAFTEYIGKYLMQAIKGNFEP